MTGPIGFPANAGSGIDNFKAIVLGWIRDEITKSKQGGNGLHVDGATGDLVADRGQFRSMNYVPGSAGWGMQPSGNAEFNDLTLRGGIIGNAALTSPVAMDNASGASNGFAVTIADQDLAVATIPVPAGYSQALVFIEVTTSAYNNTAVYAYLYVQALVNGIATRLMPAGTGTGTATVSTAKSVTLTGLSGGTISVAARVRCDNGWAAAAANRAYSETIVVFLR